MNWIGASTTLHYWSLYAAVSTNALGTSYSAQRTKNLAGSNFSNALPLNLVVAAMHFSTFSAHLTHSLPLSFSFGSSYVTPITVPISPSGVRTISFTRNPNGAVSSSDVHMTAAVLPP